MFDLENAISTLQKRIKSQQEKLTEGKLESLKTQLTTLREKLKEKVATIEQIISENKDHVKLTSIYVKMSGKLDKDYGEAYGEKEDIKRFVRENYHFLKESMDNYSDIDHMVRGYHLAFKFKRTRSLTLSNTKLLCRMRKVIEKRLGEYFYSMSCNADSIKGGTQITGSFTNISADYSRFLELVLDGLRQRSIITRQVSERVGQEYGKYEKGET